MTIGKRSSAPLASIAIVGLLLGLAFSDSASARIGGGRSFGGRGSRSMAPRSYNSAPRYSAPRPVTPPPAMAAPMPSMGGAILGIGGRDNQWFIGSMLFRSLGYGGMGMNGMPMAGGGGFGLLELLFAGLATSLPFIYGKSSNRPCASPHELSAGDWTEPQAPIIDANFDQDNSRNPVSIIFS